MRAARISALSEPPQLAEIEDTGTVEVLAVALNPLDLSVNAGRFYGGHPPLPYVPGCEAVVRLDGARMHVSGEGRGTQRDGFLSERVVVGAEVGVPVPDGLDDAAAAVCGIAGLAGWIPVSRIARVGADDRVLVLGATGLAGTVAVQGAKALGAARVVAAGRDERKLERALEHGADATVRLDGDGVVERMREAAGGDGPTVVIDPLWGAPLTAATAAAAPNARIVHVGQSAGPETTLTSAVVRGKELSIQGYTYFRLSPDERASAYAELAGHVLAGRIRFEHETFSLDDVAAAWAAQQSGTKAVVLLGADEPSRFG